MTATQQLVGAASISGSVLLMLGVATSFGAAVGRHEADRQQAADDAALARRRQATQCKKHRIWAACYAPPHPTTAPTCHVRDETVPLTTVQPRRARHRKGHRTCT